MQMTKSPIDVDDVLKKLASEAVKQGENVRSTVRDLTLRALQARGLSLNQIRGVLASVTAGANLGAAKSKTDAAQSLADAVAGMDDALLRAVEASRVTLESLTDQGVSFNDSKLKRALSDLEKLEDQFLDTVKQTSEGATKQVRAQWATVLQQYQPGGTASGAEVQSYLTDWGAKVQSAMRDQRNANLKAAHLMTQSFAALANGVLIGLTEGLRRQGADSKGGKRA